MNYEKMGHFYAFRLTIRNYPTFYCFISKVSVNVSKKYGATEFHNFTEL